MLARRVRRRHALGKHKRVVCGEAKVDAQHHCLLLRAARPVLRVHDAEGVAHGVVRQHAAVDPAALAALAALDDVVQQALGRQEAAAAVGDVSELQPLLQRAALVLGVVKELERHRARPLGLGRVDAQVEDELVHVLQREEPLLPLDDDLARRPARPRLVRHQHLRLESARRRHLPVGRPRVRLPAEGGPGLGAGAASGGHGEALSKMAAAAR